MNKLIYKIVKIDDRFVDVKFIYLSIYLSIYLVDQSIYLSSLHFNICTLKYKP